MGSWTVQLLTLVAVVVGAMASFVTTRMIEKARWQRDEAVRWAGKRLDCYTEFALAIKRYIMITRRINVTRGLPATDQPLDPEIGLPILAEAEQELSVKWEQLLMLGSPECITAAEGWRQVALHTEWFARGLRNDPDEYTQAVVDGGKARRRFYNAVRSDLGITSGQIPELAWPPAWRESSTGTVNDGTSA